MPATIYIGGLGARSQYNEWLGPPATDPTLNSFARIPKNPELFVAVPAGVVTYSTSDPTVATVDAQGNITAVGPGTCTITATDATNHTSASDILTVRPAQLTAAATLNLIKN
jgi:hypothetical protein